MKSKVATCVKCGYTGSDFKKGSLKGLLECPDCHRDVIQWMAEGYNTGVPFGTDPNIEAEWWEFRSWINAKIKKHLDSL